jgi:CRP/FNR family cyclic AMP-dependent transcriptional regulator
MSALEGFDEFDGIELFQKLPIFRGLNFDETRRLGAIARSETYRKGDVIVDQNELGSALYVIKSGTVRVTKQEGDAELDLGTMGVGSLFGEMTLVDDVLTSARVTASEDVELIVLPRLNFDALLDTDVALALKVYRAFCRTLSDKLRQLHQKMGAP